MIAWGDPLTHEKIQRIWNQPAAAARDDEPVSARGCSRCKATHLPLRRGYCLDCWADMDGNDRD